MTIKLYVLVAAVGIVLALAVFVLAEFLIVVLNGTKVPAPSIPRGPQMLGSGPALSYVVMGDSTAIAQGAPYAEGYALYSAEHLAENHRVQFVNLGVSGARAQDVAASQAGQAASYKPDIVLIAVGANDVTHLTSNTSVAASMQTVIDILRRANPAVKIVLTGAPAMGSIPRLPWPLKQLAGSRTRSLNDGVFAPLAARDHLTFAPIAAKTGAAFAADPTLFAADKFHPNARGYALWRPVVTEALDQALASAMPLQ